MGSGVSRVDWLSGGHPVFDHVCNQYGLRLGWGEWMGKRWGGGHVTEELFSLIFALHCRFVPDGTGRAHASVSHSGVGGQERRRKEEKASEDMVDQICEA